MILVTGGTGLVGSHLLYELISKNKTVIALKRENSDVSNVLHVFSYYTENFKDLFDKINWVNGDITDFDSIFQLLDNIDEIYHCAATVSFNPKKKYQLIKNNVDGTKNIVNAALEKTIKKLCYVSSIATVGNTEISGSLNENHYLPPSLAKSIYSYSKLNAEMEVWRGVTEGLNAVIVNPSFILGPGNWTKSSSKIFDTVFKGLKFYTNGVTGFVDVRDVVQIMIKLMEKDVLNERFIINSENLSYSYIFSTIAENFKVNSPQYYASPFLFEIAWRLEKIRSILFNTSPVITKENAKSAYAVSYYSNQKIIEKLHFQFIPIHKSIQFNCKMFLKDHC